MWESLKEIALIGTEKKPLSKEVLPEAIREQLATLNPASGESEFLQAMALSTYYLQAGTLHQHVPTADPAIIHETQDQAESDVMELFIMIEDADKRIQERLLNLWLNLLIHRSWIAQSALIVRIVQLAETLSASTQAKVLEVIGNKGRWMLSFYQGHRYTLNPASNVWQEGTNEQRKQHFEALRMSDPTQAIALLQATWDTEAIVIKRSFLELISSTLNAEDVSFLEPLHQGEFSYHPKEKKTERECRALVAGMLLRSTNSLLYKETSELLAGYIHTPKKPAMLRLLSGNSTRISIPEGDALDELWNPDLMLHRFGFEVQYDIAIYTHVNYYWLSLFLSFIPMTFWLTHFSKGHEAFLDYFLGDSFQAKVQNQQHAIFLSALIDQVINTRDSELAKHLVERVSLENAHEVFQNMTLHDFESFVQKNGFLSTTSVLESTPDQETWSIGFSAAVIRHAYIQLEQASSKVTPQLGKVVSQYAHHGAMKDLDDYHEKAKNLTKYTAWQRNFYAPVKQSFIIRKTITSYQ